MLIPEAHPTVVFILGGPGAGKGTQCTRIANQFRYVHLSMGDLLREEATRPGPDADVIQSHIMQGMVVPSEIAVRVLMQAIERTEDWRHRKFLIDGFPREASQMDVLKATTGRQLAVKACLFFDVTEANLRQRLIAHGESSEARADDTLDVIEQRIENWKKAYPGVQRYFQYEGLLERIDANREVEKVWADVQTYFVVEGYKDQPGAEPSHGSPVKAVWKLRGQQKEEVFPTGHSHTSMTYTKGLHARHFTSYTILNRHREKHTRNLRSPTEHFHEPMTLAQEIGWHQPDDGTHIGAKGTPRGSSTPRAFYPKNTCSMTRHMENMYNTNAQHIIRRW